MKECWLSFLIIYWNLIESCCTRFITFLEQIFQRCQNCTASDWDRIVYIDLLKNPFRKTLYMYVLPICMSYLTPFSNCASFLVSSLGSHNNNDSWHIVVGVLLLIIFALQMQKLALNPKYLIYKYTRTYLPKFKCIFRLVSVSVCHSVDFQIFTYVIYCNMLPYKHTHTYT